MRIVTVFNTLALRRGLTITEQEYNIGHVHALQKQLAKYAPGVPFEVMSNVQVPGVTTRPLKHKWLGWWAKMELLDPEVPGDFLFMDLDTVISGSLSDILAVDKLTLLRDFYRDGKKLKEGLGGGLIYFPDDADLVQPVWDYWIENPPARMREYPRGDQFLFEKFWLHEAARWQDEVPGQVVSWKVHCAQGVPPDARVICFHGKPRPWEVGPFLNLYR
jgi:hypothetical protein